jgi:hypothetical protein
MSRRLWGFARIVDAIFLKCGQGSEKLTERSSDDNEVELSYVSVCAKNEPLEGFENACGRERSASHLMAILALGLE